MARDLGRLEIDRLIVHDVPSHRVNVDGPKPTLSEIDRPLTPIMSFQVSEAAESVPTVFENVPGTALVLAELVAVVRSHRPLRHFPESRPCRQSSSSPFCAAHTTISCFKSTPSFT